MQSYDPPPSAEGMDAQAANEAYNALKAAVVADPEHPYMNGAHPQARDFHAYSTRLTEIMVQAEAEKVVKPLAAQVQALEKRCLTIKDRIASTHEDVDRKVAALTTHRAAAGEKLSKSSSSFSEWQGRLRRLVREHETACEALDLLERELRPATDRELETTKRELHRAVVSVVAAARPECERAMAEHIAAAVDLRVAFLADARKLFEGFGVGWTGESADHERVLPEPQVYRPKDAAYLTATALVDVPVDRQLVPPSLRPPEPAPAGAATEVTDGPATLLTGSASCTEPVGVPATAPSATAGTTPPSGRVGASCREIVRSGGRCEGVAGPAGSRQGGHPGDGEGGRESRLPVSPTLGSSPSGPSQVP